VVLTDVAALTATIGRSEAIDTRFLLSSRAPLRPALHRAWALDLAQVLASVKGRAKKVVALDCDNTLWGGIVGEDGIDGIALDPAEAPGRAYFNFQRQLLDLKGRGVLLVLCSRNNEADVLKVIDDHPHCLVRREALADWE